MANTARRKDELEFEVTKPEFAGSANDIRTFSDQQREIQAQMNANSKAWHTADDAEKTRLHEQNQILAAALGGSTSFNNQTGKWEGEGAYNKTAKFYGDQPGGYGSYSSKYSRQIDDLWNQLSNYGYGDFLNGDLYGALEGQYTNLGQQAMQDTLGQVSARTGGMASSYAGTVAQAAYNNYMQQLEQAAMDMYADEYGRKSNNLSTLMSMDNNAYNRFTNERDFNYALKQDELAQAGEKAQMLAAFGDYSGYSALGYTPDQIAMMEAAAAAAAKGKGGTGKKEEKPTISEAVKARGLKTESEILNYLYDIGKSSTEAAAMVPSLLEINNPNKLSGSDNPAYSAWIALDSWQRNGTPQTAAVEEIRRNVEYGNWTEEIADELYRQLGYHFG